MKQREWHIWDFPDNLYVLIEEKVRKEFFQAMYKRFGSQKRYAQYLKKDRNCIQGYYHARYWHKRKKVVKFTPIKVLKQSLPYTSSQLQRKIGKHILSIRGRGGGQIDSPLLPIRESPTFYKVVAHILGDGNDSHTPYYSNTSDVLMVKFKKDLQVFGEITLHDAVNEVGVKYTSFTKTVTYILGHVLNVKFTHPDRIPDTIFSASDQCKAAFLQALYDDEGTMSSALAISMKKGYMVEQIKTVVESLGIETTRISYKNKGRFGEGDMRLTSELSTFQNLREK